MKSADKIIKQNLPTTYGDDGIVLAKYAPNREQPIIFTKNVADELNNIKHLNNLNREQNVAYEQSYIMFGYETTDQNGEVLTVISSIATDYDDYAKKIDYATGKANYFYAEYDKLNENEAMKNEYNRLLYLIQKGEFTVSNTEEEIMKRTDLSLNDRHKLLIEFITTPCQQ